MTVNFLNERKMEFMNAFILAGYIIYRAKFKINKEMYDRIISDLRARGELHTEPAEVIEMTETVEVEILKE